jgi:hypothetical protein
MLNISTSESTLQMSWNILLILILWTCIIGIGIGIVISIYWLFVWIYYCYTGECPCNEPKSQDEKYHPIIDPIPD